VTTRILVVEDDERIRTTLCLALEDEGYSPFGVSSGEEALDVIGRRPTDIVLVDLMLPGIDGFELTRRIRKSNDVPIIVLTARNDTHDVVAGLEAGADDYVTKPFVVKELSARIRAHMRRAHGPSDPGSDSDRVVVGALEVSQAEGAVRLDGQEAHLTRTEFRLLWELASAPGRVFSRETLLERVWGYDYFGDTRLVDVHVRRLRTKIEPDPSNPRYVVTVRGLGYKLAP
jgi:DNA-binding response OmpR family regulator